MRARRLTRSLTFKLGLVLFLAVASAIGIVYLVVIPRLESRLVNAKIAELKRAAPTAAFNAAQAANPNSASFSDYDGQASAIASTFDVRAVIFGTSPLRVLGDSSPNSRAVSGDPIARLAAEHGKLEAGRTERGEKSYAEMADPTPAPGEIVLLSAPLHDALSTVRLVRRSLVLAGVLALIVALAAGIGAAWTLTRRLRALESAAERLAAGNFAAPVDDTGQDEVGQLARAFDRMRQRLAHLDDVRREFIANASHELRTPLFSLAGFAELLSDEELDERTRREFLLEMRSQIERLTKLATDLLDLSRLDAGQLAVDAVEVDLAATAGLLVDEFRPVAELHGHRLQLDVSGTALALGDEQRVLQIGRALVENAIRHTPEGTSIELVSSASDGHATLAVRDDGPGISEADREHLFERFYRGAGQHASGSGLGLAIASELAVRMNGGIEVRSEAGETVFTLTLPGADGRDGQVNSTGKRQAPEPEPAGASRATAPARR